MTGRARIPHDVVDRLVRFKATDAQVLSVYVPVPADRTGERWADSMLHSLLKPARELADSDELDRDARQSLRDDVLKVREVGERLPNFQGRAVLVVSCAKHGFYEEITLPRAVRPRVVIDRTPYLRPALAVIDESHRYLVAVLDRENAWLYDFFMDELVDTTSRVGGSVRKRDYGGWQGYAEHRVRNKAEMLARLHLRDTAEEVEQLMASSGAEFLIVGGHEEIAAQFVPFLPAHLQEKVVDRFAIDTHTITADRVRARAAEAVTAFERREEEALVAQTFERAAAGGFAAVGLPWVLAAADEKAVQLLLINDDDQVPGRVCDNCGWLGLDGDPCPVCSQPTRESADVIDEAAAAVIDAGGRVEHVYASTELADRHVAALLRFPVPRPELGSVRAGASVERGGE